MAMTTSSSISVNPFRFISQPPSSGAFKREIASSRSEFETCLRSSETKKPPVRAGSENPAALVPLQSRDRRLEICIGLASASALRFPKTHESIRHLHLPFFDPAASRLPAVLSVLFRDPLESEGRRTDNPILTQHYRYCKH